ncbi:hypothetical protein Ddye_011790, partial [Dipteronia dyeriana]
YSFPPPGYGYGYGQQPTAQPYTAPSACYSSSPSAPGADPYNNPFLSLLP